MVLYIYIIFHVGHRTLIIKQFQLILFFFKIDIILFIHSFEGFQIETKNCSMYTFFQFSDHCPPPILDLRLKLNMSRSQSSVSLGFSTPRSGFETQHGSVRAHKTPRNHRDLSADSRNRSDPSRPEQKRDSTLKRQDAYHTPRRSTFASLLSSNNQTPRTPKEYLAPKALTFSPSNEVWAAEFIARSESYRYSFIDSHCHLDFMYNRMGVPFQTEYSDFMEDHKDSYPDNYEGCVAVFCNPRTFHLHRKCNS